MNYINIIVNLDKSKGENVPKDVLFWREREITVFCKGFIQGLRMKGDLGQIWVT